MMKAEIFQWSVDRKPLETMSLLDPLPVSHEFFLCEKRKIKKTHIIIRAWRAHNNFSHVGHIELVNISGTQQIIIVSLFIGGNLQSSTNIN